MYGVDYVRLIRRFVHEYVHGICLTIGLVRAAAVLYVVRRTTMNEPEMMRWVFPEKGAQDHLGVRGLHFCEVNFFRIDDQFDRLIKMIR